MFGLNKRKYFRIVAFMLMLTTLLPVISNNLPTYVGSYHFFAAIWLGSILIFYPRIIVQKYFLFFLFFGLVFIGLLRTLWSEMTVWDKGGLLMEFYIFSVAISVILYFKIEKDYEGLAWLVKWSLIFVGITSIMTIYSTSLNSMAGRYMINPDAFNSWEEFQQFKKLGTGSHGLATTLGALFPMMFYYYRNNTSIIFSKKIIIFYGIIGFIVVLRIQIFANILLSSAIIIISFLGRKKIRQSLLVLFLLFIIFIIIPMSLYADFLRIVSSYFNPQSEIYFKLNDMAKYLTIGDSYGTATGGRAARYPLLFSAFIENPLFGYFTGDHSKSIAAGGHLYWMYKLTIVGIFGFIPYLILHFTFIKNVVSYIKKNEEFTFYYLVSISAIIGLGFMKNLAGREMWFTYFIILPGIYFLPLLKNRKQRKYQMR
ncbi:MAG: hypothetical protein KQI35_03525 [Bacteroidetes bacterium]|nr:hypothetical protein [Bacteroidota bacterium]